MLEYDSILPWIICRAYLLEELRAGQFEEEAYKSCGEYPRRRHCLVLVWF